MIALSMVACPSGLRQLLRPRSRVFAKQLNDCSHTFLSPFGLIPTALRDDRFCPFSGRDGGDPFRGRDERVPGLATGIDECCIGLEDTVCEVVLAQELPDV